MLTEPWDLALWSSPASETEVQARIRARTRTLRRRRLIPTVGALAGLLVGLGALVSLPDQAVPVRVATGGADPADPSPVEGNPASTSTPDAPHGSGPSAGSSSQPPPAPRVVAPVVGPIRPPAGSATPGAPSSHSTGHPVLRDLEGDAWVTTDSSGGRSSDPAFDITHLDVRADATTVTTELRLLDMTGERLAADRYGKPTRIRYQVSLLRDDGYFSFYVELHADGNTSASGTFWSGGSQVDDVNAGYTGHAVSGVHGTCNVRSGIVQMTATFEAMNRAMGNAAGTRSEIARGTVVDPRGYAYAHWEDDPVWRGNAAIDKVQSSDPEFGYRLGD